MKSAVKSVSAPKPNKSLIKTNEKCAYVFSSYSNDAEAVSYCIQDYKNDETLLSDFKAYLTKVSLQDFINDWMLLAPRSEVGLYLFDNSLAELDEFFNKHMHLGNKFRPLVSLSDADLSSVVPRITDMSRRSCHTVGSRMKMAIKTNSLNQDIYFGFDYEAELIEAGIAKQAETPFVATEGQAGWIINRLENFYKLK